MDDTLLKQSVDPLIHLFEGEFAATPAAAAALLGELQDELADNLEIACLDALSVGGAALGEPVGLEHNACLLYKVVGGIFVAGRENVVHAACYELASASGGFGGQELGVVEAEHLIAADSKLFQELGVGGFADVHVAVLLLVALGVVFHGAFQSVGYADVVNDQSAYLVLVYAVYTSDSLHQVISAHGLVYIHGGEAWHVEAGEPHVYDDHDFKRVHIILEAFCHLFDAGFVAHYVKPPFGVLIAHSHDDSELALLFPGRAKIANPLVYSHRGGARVGYNHRLAGEFVRAVCLVVLHDVLT